jgi:site-specific recombinase XerD
LRDFLGEVDVERITTTDLRRYIADMWDQDTLYPDHHRRDPQTGGLSPFTVAGRVRVMKRLFNWLVEEGLLEDTPARRIKTPKPERDKPKGIAHEDFLALLKTTEEGGTIDRRDLALMLFLADTGCRVGGLCGLCLGDLDFEENLATLTEKGSKTRLVPFCEVTAVALQRWLDVRPTSNSPEVFLKLGRWGKRSGPLATRGVSQMLKRRAKRGGIEGPVNPHSFRHAFARDFLLSGGDLGALKDILGHSTIVTTKESYGIYTIRDIQKKHRKHSPIARLHIEEGKDEDDS